MDTEVTGSGEALSAGRTLVWPGASVDSLVISEGLLPLKALLADVTFEGLDFGVRHFVVAESARGGEGAVAGVTPEWRLLEPVSRLMDSELSQQFELPVALVAAQQLVRVFLLSVPKLVAQLVALQRLGFVETFIAGAAGKRLQMT